ncbi:MAG TPA: methionyl-tRNA formyltransferase [Rubrivivax sp.]
MRVVFAGTPEFAAVALEAIRRAGFEVPLVLTQPDRPAGRGLQLQPSAVKTLALTHGCPVVQPRSLRLDGRHAEDAAVARQALLDCRPDVMVVAAYGLILPAWALELPLHGCLNIHASLLPRWRGAAPIQRAIEAGDEHTGITIMQMDAGLDTGDMLLSERLAIEPGATSARLHTQLAAIGGRLIVEALGQLGAGRLQRAPQPATGVSYAHKIDKAESLIDWHDGAAVIERRVRAFDPFPGASLVCQGEVLKLWRAAVLRPGVAPPAAAGTVVGAGEHLNVACGEGVLSLLEVQRPGGRRIPVAQYLRSGAGATLQAGVSLVPAG